MKTAFLLLMGCLFVSKGIFAQPSRPPFSLDLIINEPWRIGPDKYVTLVGRVVREGEPVAGVSVGVVAREDWPKEGVHRFTSRTDEEGQFEFTALGRELSWRIYGVMESLGEKGALRGRLVPSLLYQLQDVVDLGSLELSESFQFKGTVVTRDRQPLLADFALNIVNEDTGDSISIRPDDEGRFEAEGLYSGAFAIQIDTPGWRFTPKNRSIEDRSPSRLVGFIEKEHAEAVLEIELGAGKSPEPDTASNTLPPGDRPEGQVLRGIERTGGVFLRITGTVVDAGSGKPLNEFEVLPGRQPPVPPKPATRPSILETLTEPFREDVGIPRAERPWWDPARMRRYVEGKFDLEFEVMTSKPVFQILADGYRPFVSGEIFAPTNMIVRMEKVNGPNGVVLLPEGQLANGATVLYLGELEQGQINNKGVLRFAGSSGSDVLLTTGADGRFDFQLRAEGRRLFVAHPKGWASVGSENFHEGGRLRLRKWSSVEGILVNAKGTPAPDAILQLQVSRNPASTEPWIHPSSYVTTDAKGEFRFDYVPSGELELIRDNSITVSGGTRGNYKIYYSATPAGVAMNPVQTRFRLDAGENLDLGEIIFDSPPPPSVLERVQEKLGL